MHNRIGLGIDVGGTKIAGALFGSGGMISDKQVLLLDNKKGREVGQQIILLINKFLEQATDRNLKINCVGVAIPGIYYSKTGHVWAPNIPGWENYPLYSELKETLDLSDIDLKIDSDRACYILGESWKGSAAGCQNAIFLAVGTGIGAGILVDGRILRGANDIAGAIGWLALTRPYISDYGKFGCFEYHASGAGITRMAKNILAQNQAVLRGSEQLHNDPITAENVFEAYHLGDPNAITVIQQSIEFWGKASANLVSLFNPEKIIFGGGVFGPAVAFLEDIYLEAKKWAQPVSMDLVKFESSSFGNDAGL